MPAFQHKKEPQKGSKPVQEHSPSLQQERTDAFVDNRTEASFQLKLQEMANHYSAGLSSPGKVLQQKTDSKALPEKLQSGLESLSGQSMEGVKVHYNSPQPAQLQAKAFAHGNDIHLASGQERHLPHEAWHVVQQKQRKVNPTVQTKGLNINDNKGLEKEADVMGKKALRITDKDSSVPQSELAASKPSPVVQGVFADDTTFGLEVEFKNRWVSPFDYGKNLKEFSIPDGPLKDWKAGTDRGRTTSEYPGTVLEYESAVFSGKDWSDDKVNSAVEEAFDQSLSQVENVRLENTLSDPGSKEQTLLNEQSPDKEDKVKAIKQNKEQIIEDHKETPQATVQITTLGKRTDEHLKELDDTSTDIDSQNAEKAKEKGWEGVANKLLAAKAEAKNVISNLKSKAKLDSPEDKLVMEDLAAITSVMVQSICLAEGDMRSYGTIKNLVDPLPRRIIGPPDEGFKERLKIPDSLYLGYLKEYQGRAQALGDSQSFWEMTDPIFSLAWFASGAMDINDVMINNEEWDEKKQKHYKEDTLLGQILYLIKVQNKEENKQETAKSDPSYNYPDKPSLWHEIAGSLPTLEDSIIKAANKKHPEEWTSHEIRNILFAQAMSKEDMIVFLDVLKKHMPKSQ